ncbi:hypothetical protein Pth03_18730 [Planotetraspora thailandica]|uniref:Uncharacterized protein n=1 Tax=Planotetraspora thailandica TaxID=487172 RepID=A0A8J3UWS7_9ACTN|nr:hypothetical protein Pth03_18730 [Planotetraspora thailandica]
MHLACEQDQKPLSILLTAGQRGDSPQANRAYLRRRGIKATIPSKADQDANRRAKGSTGGRPLAFDPEVYQQRHAVEPGGPPAQRRRRT